MAALYDFLLCELEHHSTPFKRVHPVLPDGESNELTPPEGNPVRRVETDESDEASESLPPLKLVQKPEAVVSDLFFFGNIGRTRPGSSVRSLR